MEGQISMPEDFFNFLFIETVFCYAAVASPELVM